MDLKLVDAEKLDADLGAVADAIRAKGGATEQMSFPDGMATAIRSIVGHPDYIMQKATGKLIEYSSNEYCYSPTTGMFYHCQSLEKLSVTNVHMLQYRFAMNCSALVEVNVPKGYYIGQEAFSGCTMLPRLDLPVASTIYTKAFSNCKALETLILRYTNGVATLRAIDAFTGTPIASGTGYIYVPSVLVDSYKAATNWSTYADQIRAIEDYPEITGGAKI